MIDVAPALRAAILGNNYIMSRVTSVITRLPVPDGTVYPCIVIPFNSVVTDQDGLTNKRTVITRDIMVYGNIAAAGTTEDQTRRVDEVAFELRKLFHRNKRALVNTSYHVIDIRAYGPVVAPTETYASSQPSITGRMVTLTLRIEDGS